MSTNTENCQVWLDGSPLLFDAKRKLVLVNDKIRTLTDESSERKTDFENTGSLLEEYINADEFKHQNGEDFDVGDQSIVEIEALNTSDSPTNRSFTEDSHLTSEIDNTIVRITDPVAKKRKFDELKLLLEKNK
jgi:hypothetical protein